MTTIKQLALFAALPTLAHAGVVAHYSFDTDSSDSSGNDNHGTLVDVDTLENSGITTTAGEFVFGGASMNFSEDRDYVEIPSKTFGTGTAYTITFWAADSSCQRNRAGRKKDVIRSLEVEAFPRSAI